MSVQYAAMAALLERRGRLAGWTPIILLLPAAKSTRPPKMWTRRVDLFVPGHGMISGHKTTRQDSGDLILPGDV